VKAGPAHEVRIIGGQWKRSKLPVADRPGLRPTPDRVRETLFNWLGQDLSGWRCLDAFAGSGALGFEAASRGAAEVVLLERDPALVASLLTSRQRLKAEALRVEGSDAIGWMGRAAPGSFDLLLLDPPFGTDLAERALPLATRLATADGLIYLELRQALAALPDGWDLHRQGRAGAVHFHLLRRAGAATLAASVPRSSP
jgi:16S rRNA (guanine966-N2)-methyltransferase